MQHELCIFQAWEISYSEGEVGPGFLCSASPPWGEWWENSDPQELFHILSQMPNICDTASANLDKTAVHH